MRHNRKYAIYQRLDTTMENTQYRIYNIRYLRIEQLVGSQHTPIAYIMMSMQILEEAEGMINVIVAIEIVIALYCLFFLVWTPNHVNELKARCHVGLCVCLVYHHGNFAEQVWGVFIGKQDVYCELHILEATICKLSIFLSGEF